MSDTSYRRILERLDVVGENGTKATARCPAHDDNHASLSIGLRRDGKGIVLCCHAGCQTPDVLGAIGLSMRDLFDDNTMREVYAPRRDYHYPDGRLVHRKPNKDFPQSGNTKGNSLFHADKIGNARTVYVPEGEKDVEAIELVGAAPAVCPPMGAGQKNLDRYDWDVLRGKDAIIIADKDDAGRKHAMQVAELLRPIAKSMRIVEAAAGKDAADHIAAGKTLDELVEVRREAVKHGIHLDDGAQSLSIDGAELLDDIRAFLARFIVYPSEHELVAHTLWIAHTWLMDCWESTPRVAFLSPEPGSGKSRALEVTEPLVPRPVHAINTTSAYLFRKVSDPKGPPTILYDEIDTVFGPKAKENEDIRGILNAGHRKGAMAGRCVVRGKIIETEELPAYCAAMLAGLDDLPDTLMSRSVVIRMRRRAPCEPVEPWRHRINAPEAKPLSQRLASWADSVRDTAAQWWPEMPPGVEDRNADLWEALLAVAELAGGHWPKTARVAAVTAVTASKSAVPSLGVMLLRDIRDVFNKLDICNCVTDQLLTDLRGIEESPWAVIRKGEPLNASGLARRLGKYGIGPKAIRNGNQVFKGYARAQFEDAWMRYVDPLGPPDIEAVTAVTPTTSAPDPATNGHADHAQSAHLFDEPF